MFYNFFLRVKLCYNLIRLLEVHIWMVACLTVLEHLLFSVYSEQVVPLKQTYGPDITNYKLPGQCNPWTYSSHIWPIQYYNTSTKEKSMGKGRVTVQKRSSLLQWLVVSCNRIRLNEIAFQLFAKVYQLLEPSTTKERDVVYESLTYSSELYVSTRLIFG